MGFSGGSIVAMMSSLQHVSCILNNFCVSMDITSESCDQVVALAEKSLKDLETLPFTMETEEAHHISAAEWERPAVSNKWPGLDAQCAHPSAANAESVLGNILRSVHVHVNRLIHKESACV